MNAAFVILGALAVAVGGYRWYAGYIDRKVVESDPHRVTPARMYMDGVDFMPTTMLLGSLAQNKLLWGIFAIAFCYISAVLPIWRFALPLNYVAFYIVMLGLVGGIVGIFVGLPTIKAPPFTQFTIKVGPLWPMLFVTIACGAISGWHSLVSTSGTCRQLERETDGKSVLAGSMYVEMILGVVALMTAAAAMPYTQYQELLKAGPAAVFATGLSNLLNVIGLPLAYGKTMATVIIVVLAITVMQLVLRFMKVATIELVGDYTPILRNDPTPPWWQRC